MSLLLPAPDGFARLENLIDGKRCPALSRERLASVDPSIGETWAEIPSSGSDDIAAAAEAVAARDSVG